MSGSFPQTIPPQTASLGKADADGNVTIDITWYLLLYNLTTQVLNAANGSLTVTPFDLLLLDGADIAETTETESTGNGSGVDTADIDAVGADVAKLQPGPRDVDSTDIDASAADAAQLLSALQTAQALIAEIIDSASAIDAANASKLLGATWSAPGAIGSGTPNTISGTTGAFSGTVTVNNGLANYLIAAGGSTGQTPYLQATGSDTDITLAITTKGAGHIKTYTGAFGTLVTDVSATGLAVTGALSATTTVKTGGYTVATLPVGTIGMHAYVTDAVAPTFLGLLVGGGTVTTPVFYNGSAWVSD